MKKILQKENPILRKKAVEVQLSEISSTDIAKLLSDMRNTLANEEDGVALAAPQIGISKRVFIVSGKIFRSKDAPETDPAPPDAVFINPKIIKFSKRKVEMEEGCLSVKFWYGKITRSDRVKIEAYDEKGVKFERGAGNLLAQIFQHEIDHLDGKLFSDKTSDLRQILPEKNAEEK